MILSTKNLIKTSDRFYSRSQSNFCHGLSFYIISFIQKKETPPNNGPHTQFLGFVSIIDNVIGQYADDTFDSTK